MPGFTKTSKLENLKLDVHKERVAHRWYFIYLPASQQLYPGDNIYNYNIETYNLCIQIMTFIVIRNILEQHSQRESFIQNNDFENWFSYLFRCDSLVD